MIPTTVMHSTPVKSGIPSIHVSEPETRLEDQQSESLYEELKQKQDDQMIEQDETEGYDHLDFRRPVNELKPQYLSTESILSQRSRNSSSRSKESPAKSQEELKMNTAEMVMSDVSGTSSSDHNWTDSVLSSLEKLNNSGSRTRKGIYQPETGPEFPEAGRCSISPTVNV